MKNRIKLLIYKARPLKLKARMNSHFLRHLYTKMILLVWSICRITKYFPLGEALSTRFQIKALKYKRLLKQSQARDEFVRVLPLISDKISIDLGANLGVYTKLLARNSKLVIAFEPDPWTFKQLKRECCGNKNVKLENVAAGLSNRFVKLYRHQDFHLYKKYFSIKSSLRCSSEINQGDCVDVEQIDFIRYIEDLDEDIGIIKMDIEGMELELLEALLRRPDLLSRIDYIFSEFSDMSARHNYIIKQAQQIHRPKINLDWP